ncbi:hypothetical protein [Clostridium peptidivorans]|uniref:hypothetical protein n=1 Tax=Clostridium peptidivorans TaxID=100174 RepID=UPI000BE2D5E7|nr:hypothetical protein [Clostridium peptidivorans]
MKISKYNIKGINLLKITNLLKDISDINQYFKQLSESSFIFASETYYFRISSDLLSIVSLNFISDNECEIEIISGGGKEGMLSLSLGAESSRIKDIYKQLNKICESNSWTIEIVE